MTEGPRGLILFRPLFLFLEIAMNEGMTGYLDPKLKRQRQQFNNSSPLAKRIGSDGTILFGLGDLLNLLVLPWIVDKTGVLPSATLAVNGVPYSIAPDSGFANLFLTALALISSSVGSETVTM